MRFSKIWRVHACFATALAGFLPRLSAAALPPVFSSNVDPGANPRNEMRAYLLTEADEAWGRWQRSYEARTEPAEIRAHEAHLRAAFVAAVGGLPDRTPLQAHTIGILERDGYHVEKVIFESRPQFYVTASLYLPDPRHFPPPYPGVLIPCGHTLLAKAYDAYQAMGALLALNGMAALVFDSLEQGERIQMVGQDGRWKTWGSAAHTFDDIQAIPLGQSLAREFIWDGMRAIDYLQSRPEIDPARLGCTGNSGGGMETTYLVALDDRIKAAAPSCYVQTIAGGFRDSAGQLYVEGIDDGEQMIFGAFPAGLDGPDFLLMRAPAPAIEILAATHDFTNIHATWDAFRYAKRAYTQFGLAERMDILENNAPHNYDRLQREGAARWMSRWLLGRDVVIREPALRLFSEAELRCTPRGQVMLLPGARSIRDLLRAEADLATQERSHTWAGKSAAQRRAAVREIAGFPAMSELPPAAWTPAREDLTLRWGSSGHGYRVEAWRVRTADDAIDLPALWFEPDQPTEQPALVALFERGLDAETAEDGRLARLAQAGRRLLVIDVRGTGETRRNTPTSREAFEGSNGADYYLAYMLGKSFVGMQAEDVLTAVREALRRTHQPQVDLLAVGGVGVPALHAAFAEPALFHHLSIEHSLRSWDDVVRAEGTSGQLMNLVHGALRVYDLPDLAAGLESKLTLQAPAGAKDLGDTP